MPLIRVHLIEGRPPEAIERLGAELTDVVERVLDAPRATIRVIVSEHSADHWFKDGRSVAASRARQA